MTAMNRSAFVARLREISAPVVTVVDAGTIYRAAKS